MSDKDGELIIRKATVAVEIGTEKGTVVRGEVFVRPHEGSDRGERLHDVLAQRWFVPVKTPERLVFIAVRHVVYVKLDLLAAIDELDSDAENDANSCVALVLVELQDGSRLEGRVRYALPEPSRRLGDYLEHLPMFFPILTEDFVYLVNSTSVVSVTALEEKR